MSPATTPPPAPVLTRRIRFRASHRYHRAEWDGARNAATFGEQGRLHAHEWVVDVSVRGPVDPDTGWSVDLGSLDRELEALREGLVGRDLGEAIPGFGPTGRQPSTEELAAWIWDHLSDRIPGRAVLVGVRVAESDTLWSECVREEGS